MTIARPSIALRQPLMPYPREASPKVTRNPAANSDTTPREVVVRRQWLAAEGIKAIELAAADDSPLPPVAAGAHFDLHMPDGTVRQYSVTNPGATPECYRIAVLREAESRGGSSYLVDQLQDGATLAITGPRNHFALDEGAAAFRLIAGGIGVTPLLAMARRLVEIERPIEFHYLVRSRARAAFVDELQALLPSDALHLHVESETGRPDLQRILGPADSGHQIYTCGPAGLLDAIITAAADWPAGRVRFERFVNTALQESPAESSETCRVTLQQSGTRFDLQPDETLLEALEREDIDVPCCCREGICGTCAVGIVEGAVDHRDALQDDEEKALNDVMYVCVSRPTGPHLVLDL